jgi:hypothetical protein
LTQITLAAMMTVVLTGGADAVSHGVGGEQYFIADGLNSTFELRPCAMIAGSESVFVDGMLVQQGGYSLDEANGVLWLRFRPLDLSGVVVSYRSAGTNALTVRRVPPLLTEPEAVLPAVHIPGTVLPPLGGDTIDIAGDKLIAVTVGGGRSGIDQITNVSASGVVGGFIVKAELNDQSSPLLPEGTTFELADVDRVYVEVAGKGWHGHLGDASVTPFDAALGTIDRDVVGGVIAKDSGSLRLSTAIGVPRGEYGEITMAALEGVSGPYRLLVRGVPIRLVPGTEEVYLDGRAMKRGWDADYVVDYDAAELSFTTRPRIVGGGRIEVRFQYATDAYSRELGAGKCSYSLGPVTLEVGALREGDDPNRSLSQDLSDEERQQLALVTGDSTAAWLEGARQVRPGDGDYVRQGDRYVHVGEGAGDFRVRFTFVGEGNGDYAYDDSSYAYRYVGNRGGRYVARVRVLLPTRSEAGFAGLTASLGPVKIHVEGLGVRKNRNLLAAAPSVQAGGALALHVAAGDSGLGVVYRRRAASRHYDLPGQSVPPDFSFRWGVARPADLLETDELSCSWSRSWGASGTLSLGRAHSLGGTPVNVVEVKAKLRPLKVWFSRNIVTVRWGFGAEPAVGWVTPSVVYASSDSNGSRRASASVGLSAAPRSSVRAAITYQRDYTGGIGSTILPDAPLLERQYVTSTAKWDEATWRASATGNLALPGTFGGTTGSETYLSGALSGSWFPAAGARVQLELSQSRRRHRRYDETFTFVGPGRGEYERDSVGGYFPSAGGSYSRIALPTGDFVLATERVISGSADLSIFRPFVLTATVNDLVSILPEAAASTNRTVILRSRLDRPFAGFSPGLGLEGQSFQDPGLPATGAARSRLQGYVESGYSSAAGLYIHARVEGYVQRGGLGGGLAGVRQDGTALELRPELRRLLDGQLSLDLRRIVLSTGEPETIYLRSADVLIGRSAPLRAALRLRVEAGAAYRWATGRLPQELSATEPLGLTPRAVLRLDRVIADKLSGSLSYSFSDRPDRKADHVLEFALRATF